MSRDDRSKKKKKNLTYVQRKQQYINNDVSAVDEPTICVEPFSFPNPKFSQVDALVMRHEELNEMAQVIKTVGLELALKGNVGQNMFDIVAIMHDPRVVAVKEKYIQLRKEVDAVPEDKPVMPKPPNREALYGRVADGERIVDIGSGNSAKLEEIKQFTSHVEVSLYVDPQLHESENTTSRPMKEVLHADKEPLVTSFNVLTQLDRDDIDVIEDRDGVHIYPDIDELELSGIATRNGTDTKYVTTGHNGKTFEDQCVNLPSLKVKFGYNGANTFKKRKIEVSLKDEIKDSDYTFTPNASADSITYYGDDIGYKHDGEARQIHIRDGQVKVFNRAGRHKVGHCTDKSVQMCANLEYFPVQNIWVLCRLIYYNGFRPFHSGDLLRHAMEKLNLTIDGKKVHGPIKYKLGHPAEYEKVEVPTDGLIYRVEEDDYYRKQVWTFDVVDIEAVIDFFRRNNIEPIVEDENGLAQCDEIVEWEFDTKGKEDDSRVVFRSSKIRYDKLSHETPHEVYNKWLLFSLA